MAPSRIIADSDDEDDWSPVKSPAKALPPVAEQIIHSSDLTVGDATGSTDLAFFQSVYNEQQQAARDLGLKAQQQNTPANIPPQSGSGNATEFRMSQQVAAMDETANTSSLTELTDPIIECKRTRKTSTRAIVDLTQVTTPGRPPSSTAKDLWDVPSSAGNVDSGGSTTKPRSKNKITYSKRKRGQNSPAQLLRNNRHSSPTQALSPEKYSEDENLSPIPISKRRRIESKEIPPANDIVLAAGTGSTHLRGRESEQSDQRGVVPPSVVPETILAAEPSFYISPKALTASQKRQYQSVSLPSSSLTSSSFTGTKNHVQEVLVVTKSVKAPQKGRRVLPSNPERFSSPDEISLAEETQPGKRSSPNEVQNDRNEDVETWSDEEWGPREVGGHKTIHQPRTTHRRSNGSGVQDLVYVPAVQAPSIDDGTMDDVVEAVQIPNVNAKDAPKPKKRGRKAKTAMPEAVVSEEVLGRKGAQDGNGYQMVEIDEPAPPVKGKKKRGRPKKSDTVIPPEASSCGLIVPRGSNGNMEDSEHGTKNEEEYSRVEGDHIDIVREVEVSKRGKSSLATDDKVSRILKETNHNREARSDANYKENSESTGGGKENSLPQETTQDTNTADAHSKLSASQSAKLLYRVGLSKRSRIAPLLKVIRK
jgi:hypothetical protein